MKMTALEKQFVNSPGHSAAVSRRAERLLRLVGPMPGQHYLDVGCGNGAASIRVAEAFGLDVIGVDIDPAQLEAAEAAAAGLSNVHFVFADARVLPFPDDAFHIVATSKAMHHIPRWEDAFAELARVLAPGGHLIFGDLMAPRALAAVGLPLPSRRKVDSLAAALGLETIHEGGSPLQYEAVLRKATVRHGSGKEPS